ncbi:hypothetical protein BDK51DRAFT_32791, partial [Blyttiomyces helicus]
MLSDYHYQNELYWKRGGLDEFMKCVQPFVSDFNVRDESSIRSKEIRQLMKEETELRKKEHEMGPEMLAKEMKIDQVNENVKEILFYADRKGEIVSLINHVKMFQSLAVSISQIERTRFDYALPLFNILGITNILEKTFISLEKKDRAIAFIDAEQNHICKLFDVTEAKQSCSKNILGHLLKKVGKGKILTAYAWPRDAAQKKYK